MITKSLWGLRLWVKILFSFSVTTLWLYSISTGKDLKMTTGRKVKVLGTSAWSHICLERLPFLFGLFTSCGLGEGPVEILGNVFLYHFPTVKTPLATNTSSQLMCIDWLIKTSHYSGLKIQSLLDFVRIQCKCILVVSCIFSILELLTYTVLAIPVNSSSPHLDSELWESGARFQSLLQPQDYPRTWHIY